MDEATKWDLANTHAKFIISHSVTTKHYLYIAQCNMANKMWLNIKKAYMKDTNL